MQAVVLTGAGGVFCAGADLGEVADKGAVYRPWAGADGPLAKPCAKPVIAAVEGHAVAGGLGVALWADMRVASETAVFGVFCRRFGVPMSDGTPTRLPKVVLLPRLDMLLTGRPVRAEEALNIGLADRLAPEGQALEIATNLAQDIAQFRHSPLARADRAATWAAFDGDEAAQLIAEERGAQAAKKGEAMQGATRFKSGVGRGGEFSN